MSDTDHNRVITPYLYRRTHSKERRVRMPLISKGLFQAFLKAAGQTPNRAAHHLCQTFLLF